jgi:hypothetical protein
MPEPSSEEVTLPVMVLLWANPAWAIHRLKATNSSRNIIFINKD